MNRKQEGEEEQETVFVMALLIKFGCFLAWTTVHEKAYEAVDIFKYSRYRRSACCMLLLKLCGATDDKASRQ